MPRQIALLRGVNVGGHREFPTARQRELTEAAGYADVSVLLRTGNIVFADPGTPPEETARHLEARFASDLGFPVRVMVRTRDELAAVIEANPYPEAAAEPRTLHVTFLSEAPADPSFLDSLDPDRFAPDRFHPTGREIYLHCPNGMGRSKLAAAITGAGPKLGVTATARNWNTATKLLALANT